MMAPVVSGAIPMSRALAFYAAVQPALLDFTRIEAVIGGLLLVFVNLHPPSPGADPAVYQREAAQWVCESLARVCPELLPSLGRVQ